MDYKQSQAFLKIQQEMQKLQEYLETIHVESESNGLVITINGNGNIQNIFFENNSIIGNKEELEKSILFAFQKANKKIKEISTKKMQELLEKSPLNIPKNKNI